MEEFKEKPRTIRENSLKNLRPQKAGEPSLNPKGRPPKADCLISCIKEELAKCPQGGTLTNEQLIAMALVSKAALGDVKAIDLMLSYLHAKPSQKLDIGGTGEPVKIVYELINVEGKTP